MNRFASLCLLLAVSSSAWAVPGTLSQQGRLFDSSGVPLENSHSISFSLHDAASGGSVEWSETLSLDFDNGYYSAELGNSDSIDPSIFDRGAPLYLGIAVDGGAELPTRIAVTSVPTALVAGSAINVNGGIVDAQEIRINGTTVIDSSGKAQVSWSDLTGVPSGFADGTDDAGDKLPTCTSGQTLRTNGSGVLECADDTSIRALGCSEGEIPQFKSGDWTCVSPTDADTLSGLSCNDGEVPRWDADGSAWECASPGSGGASALLWSLELEESGGTTFADTSGGQNAAVARQGGVAAGSSGHSGRAVSFSGGSLQVDTNNTISDSPYITVEAWIEPNLPIDVDRVVVEKVGAYRIRQRSNKIEFTVTGINGACNVVSRNTISAGEWAHLRGSYNGQVAVISVNGYDEAVACTNGPIASTFGNALYVGGSTDGNSVTEPYKGSIDEVRVWATPIVSATRGGVTYVRWGRLDCPARSREVYDGWAAGPHYGHNGGPGDAVCMAQTADYGSVSTSTGNQNGGLLYRMEYQTSGYGLGGNYPSVNGWDVPCAVCETASISQIMIPGSQTCPSGWNEEYKGYLFSDYYTHAASSQAVCIDLNPESARGGSNSSNGAGYWYPIETESPIGTGYQHDREVSCVVCSN